MFSDYRYWRRSQRRVRSRTVAALFLAATVRERFSANTSAVVSNVHTRSTTMARLAIALLSITLGAAAGNTGEVVKTIMPNVPENYRIGSGDVLQISVWKEPDASVPVVVVRPDGRISMPLVKEIAVAGMTPGQVEQAIKEKLSRLIPAADVTVVVSAVNSKKIYIVGAVRREGTLEYGYRMTVMQAITEAGGPNEYARRKKIYVLRAVNGKEYQLPFNYDDALKGEKPEQNVQLLPDDVVVVPQ